MLIAVAAMFIGSPDRLRLMEIRACEYIDRSSAGINPKVIGKGAIMGE
jgi:hypothetical protein